MNIVKLVSQRDFDAIIDEDIILVKWKEGSSEHNDNNPIKAYTNCHLLHRLNELIVDTRKNTYFSIDLYLEGESYAEEVCIVTE